MPTPVGHALGGLAAAFLSPTRREFLMSPRVLWASAAIAVAPDLDILVGAHRSYTHSVGALALVAAVSWLIVRIRSSGHATEITAVMASAYASHLVLDWLGKDTSAPPGLMVLWPFSRTYYMSGFDLFGEVSRRYWLPGEFVFGNLRAVGWELLVIGPVAFVAWVVWSKGTLKAIKEKRRTKNE